MSYRLHLPTKKSLASGHVTRGLLFGSIIVVFLGFVGWQVWRISSPPSLTLFAPSEGLSTKTPRVIVVGKTAPEATLEINGQTIYHEADGRFTAPIELQLGTNKIFVKATKKHGLFTIVSRNIILEEAATISPVSVLPPNEIVGDLN